MLTAQSGHKELLLEMVHDKVNYEDIGGPFLCHYCNRVTKKGLKTATFTAYICKRCEEEHQIVETTSNLLRDGWALEQALELLGFTTNKAGGEGDGRNTKGARRK